MKRIVITLEVPTDARVVVNGKEAGQPVSMPTPAGSGGNGRSTPPITEPQKSMLRKLSQEKGIDLPELSHKAVGTDNWESITVAQASQLISLALKLDRPRNPSAAARQ